MRYSLGFQLMCFLGVMTACATIYIFLEDHKVFRPVFEKQIPKSGKVHYTFEPAVEK